MGLRGESGTLTGGLSLAEKVAVIVGVIGMATGVAGLYFTLSDRKSAEAADARNAREVIVADALQMADYDEEAGVGRQNEITLLGADADQLISEYGQPRLRLSATLYRLVGQYLTFSTTDLTTAQRMLDLALTVARKDSLEPVYVERLRGDLAAQRLQPDEMTAAYDMARTLGAKLTEPQPNLDSYTAIYRLLDAYLGANRSPNPSTTRDRFCELAEEWSADLALVQSWSDRPLVRRQLNRVSVSDAADLPGICA